MPTFTPEEQRLERVAQKMLDVSEKKAGDAFAMVFLIAGDGRAKVCLGSQIGVSSTEDLDNLAQVFRELADGVLSAVAAKSGLPYTPTASH